MLLLHIAKNIHTQNEQEKVTIDLHIKAFSSLNWGIWTKKYTKASISVIYLQNHTYLPYESDNAN